MASTAVSTPSHIRGVTDFILQTHNGAVACQVMDALHPGMVPLSKVTHLHVQCCVSNSMQSHRDMEANLEYCKLSALRETQSYTNAPD